MYKQCFNNVFVMNINNLCPNKCMGNGECKELIGCVCNPTFIYHDCSMIVKCKDDCNKNGVCHNNAKCACFPGWSGPQCNSLVSCSRNCTSIDNGSCQTDTTCKCKSGYSGNDCSINSNKTIDIMQTITKLNSEKIKIKNSEIHSDICLNNCTNNGDCNYTTGNCTCHSNFSGVDCSAKSFAVIKLKRQDSEVDKDAADDDDKPSNSTANATDITPAPAQEPTQEAIITYKVKGDIYIRTKDCTSNCTSRGICLNSTCLCEQGYSSNDCSMTYKEYLEQGYRFTGMIKFLIIALVSSSILTLIILIYRRSQKVSGDHLELD